MIGEAAIEVIGLVSGLADRCEGTEEGAELVGVAGLPSFSWNAWPHVISQLHGSSDYYSSSAN